MNDQNVLALIHASPFNELTALIVLASIAGFAGLWLRQPMIVSFIAVGVLAGPSVLDIVQSQQNIQLLAELGVAVLLALVGLKLDLKLIRSIGRISAATGLGQVIFTSIVGFGIGLALGLDTVTSLYVAVALTFSSTIIIVKLLSDKKEVDSLHGRIAIGFLIVQDLVVVLAMMVLSAFGMGSETSSGAQALTHIAKVMVYGLAMLVLVGIFVRFLATPLVIRISRSPELLIIFAIGWSALLAALGSTLGFSKELGGLLAGVSLASTPLREAILARLASLRDFLLLFFFISLGMHLDLGLLGTQIFPAVVFSLFVLVGNPLIVMVIMGAMGYRKRTGFLAGLTVAQISEFSLIFMSMGLMLGHVTPEALALVTLVGLVTIALSVYMITYSHTLYGWLEPLLGVFDRRAILPEEMQDQWVLCKDRYDILLFGLGRYGSALAEHLIKGGFCLLGVDFNPDEVRRWRKLGYNAVYGDASDQEFIGSLPLKGAKCVICAISQHDVGLTREDPRLVLMDELKRQNFNGKIAVSVQRSVDREEIEALQRRGADFVFLPYDDAAQRAAEQIRAALS